MSSSSPVSSSDHKQRDEELDEDDQLPSFKSSNSAPPLNLVVIHPLVLLSVVDHYHRVAKDTQKRVVGVLLGEISKGKVDVTNSYAVPFEEDPKDTTAWYVDRQYHEDMFAMFKKVNASEKIIGWYSTGPKIKEVDLEINELFRDYCGHPVLVIIDVNPKHDPLEIPTQAYVSIESRAEEKSKSRRQFAHLPSQIGAYEAEEVGVEHLLRNLVDNNESSLADQVNAKVTSLKGLKNRLSEIERYVDNVVTGILPVNHEIIYNIQDMFNFMPDLISELRRSFNVNTNDNSTVIYVSSLVRAILSIHDLINNKLANKQIELDEGKTEEQKKAEKAAREAEAKKKKEEKEKKENEKQRKGE
jgi:26S proteasome regulatory subunit N8